MFQTLKSKKPDAAPPAKRQTVAQLAAAVGIGVRALTYCFERGCPRDSVEAIEQWRADEIKQPKHRRAASGKVVIDARRLALAFGEAHLDDLKKSGLFASKDKEALEEFAAETIVFLCDLFDPSGHTISRRELLLELGMEIVGHSYGD